MSLSELFNFYYICFHSYGTATIPNWFSNQLYVLFSKFFFNYYNYIQIRKQINNSSKISSIQIVSPRMSKKSTINKHALRSYGNNQLRFLWKINIICILHSMHGIDKEIIQQNQSQFN